MIFFIKTGKLKENMSSFFEPRLLIFISNKPKVYNDLALVVDQFCLVHAKKSNRNFLT